MVEKLDGKYVKERIFKFLEEKGPELPVHIAKHMSLNTLFASAFLSEMASEGTIKISDMKVGGSPLYYSQSRIALLENYVNFLGLKEKEACLLLKENGILDDSIQHPAIRVALRSLKDFAIPFKKDEKIFWRYFLVSEDEVRRKLESPVIEIKKENQELIVEPQRALQEIKIEKKAEIVLEKENQRTQELESINKELEDKKRELENLKEELSKQKIEKQPLQEIKISKKLKHQTPKVEDEFLNEIKPLLEKKKIEIVRLENFDKKQVFAIIKIQEKEQYLAAFNKKKIDEEDLIKVYKKSIIHNLPYYILIRGEVSKKIKEAISVYKQLTFIEKIE